MLQNPTASTFRTALPYYDWAFKAFLCSTLFIVFFSVVAIHNWPSLIKHVSILLASILPTMMVILTRASTWWDSKQFPKEVLWVLLVSGFGLISSLLSENPWISFKSLVLFMVSGPFIFITTKYLFESRKNQDMFLWINIFVIFIVGFYGIYEYHNSLQIILFSDNPLPAGALLLLLSSSPLILLNHKNSLPVKLASYLSLILSVLLTVLLAKKGPILAMILTILFLIFTISKKYLKFFLGLFFLVGFVLYISNQTRNKFIDLVGLKPAVNSQLKSDSLSPEKTNFLTLPNSGYQFKFAPTGSSKIRMENYFFALHVFKNNPTWGVGFRANLVPYLSDYKQRFVYELGPLRYQQHFEVENTFENMILAFLIELGGLFTITYFGTLAYILIMCFRELRAHPQKDNPGMFIMSVIFGFAFLSLTFDTLRFPSLNWMFHSLLGLMVNLATNSSSERQPRSRATVCL